MHVSVAIFILSLYLVLLVASLTRSKPSWELPMDMIKQEPRMNFEYT
jgi:hypothetical protein